LCKTVAWINSAGTFTAMSMRYAGSVLFTSVTVNRKTKTNSVEYFGLKIDLHMTEDT